jgi:hypothetical protein
MAAARAPSPPGSPLLYTCESGCRYASVRERFAADCAGVPLPAKDNGRFAVLPWSTFGIQCNIVHIQVPQWNDICRQTYEATMQ